MTFGWLAFLLTLTVTTRAATITVDNTEADITGEWVDSTYFPTYEGDGYLHDGRKGKGTNRAVFSPDIPKADTYEVSLSYTTGGDRSRKVPVLIKHAEGETKVFLDQSQPPRHDNLYHPVGSFRFEKGTAGSVTISTEGTDGSHVIVDAVRFGKPIPPPKALRKPFGGIYPHLAYFNGHNECGTGAVVPWADRLWVITYGPHATQGGSDRLYEIDGNLNAAIRPESVGGTHANRMIHRESNQLFIGYHVIDSDRNVRTIQPKDLPGRQTGMARHLTDPAGRIYYATMEEGFYDVDVKTLEITVINPDTQFGKKNRMDMPGYHGKGLYSGQGRVVYANNGDNDKRRITDPTIPSGVLASWSGEQWNMIRRNQFTEVTGPGGIYGNPNPETDPVWSVGWDHRSVILMLLDGGQWHAFRLPKGSHSYDGAHGWNTEWPRIREIGEGNDLLMTMHGTFWRFPRTFSLKNSMGIAPRSNYLKVIGDFCRWNDRLVFGCDDTAMSEFINKRKAKGHMGAPGQSQSNLWFLEPEKIDRLGPAIGRGAVWMEDAVKAGMTSDPFLFNGYDRRGLHLAHDADRTVTFTLEVDRKGNGSWTELRKEKLPAAGYAWLDLTGDGPGAWIRVSVDTDCIASAMFIYSLKDPRPTRPDAKFAGLVEASKATGVGAWLRAGNLRTGLQMLTHRIEPEATTASGYYRVNVDLVPRASTSKNESTWMDKHMPPPTGVVTLDEASALYIDDSGKRYRVPVGNPAFRENPGLIDRQRASREVATERDFFQCAGTFFELPARNAHGFAKIRPVATHPYFVQDYCSWRGLLLLAGVEPKPPENDRLLVSEDGKAAVWAGAFDEVWSLGKATGTGGPWKDSRVKAGEPSDPYLMTGYDRKTLTLSHSGNATISIDLQVDISGTGLWHRYKTFEVPADKEVTYEFPEAFQAYWVRFLAFEDTVATAFLRYE